MVNPDLRPFLYILPLGGERRKRSKREESSPPVLAYYTL